MDERRAAELIRFCDEWLCGYRFNNLALLNQALTTKDCGDEYDCGENQTLEFFGDEIYDFFVTRFFSSCHSVIQDDEVFPFVSDWDQEDFTEEKIKFVKNTYLAKRGAEIGLGDLIIGSDNEMDNDIVHGDKAIREAMEAIVGAVALDMGIFPTSKEDVHYSISLDSAFPKMDEIVESLLDIEGCYNEEDKADLEIYARKVREWCQKAYGREPEVEILIPSRFRAIGRPRPKTSYQARVTIPGYESFQSESDDKDLAVYQAYYDAFESIIQDGTSYVDGKYRIEKDDVEDRPLFVLKNNMNKYFGKVNAPIQDLTYERRDNKGIWHVRLLFPKSCLSFQSKGESKSIAYNSAAYNAVNFFREHPELDETEEEPSLFEIDEEESE